MRPPILIVEDDSECLHMVEMLLTISGYTTVTAGNGVQALAQARKHHPCLILLDLMMPVMDGVEFRGVQRRDPEIAGLPVLVLSAHHDAEAISKRLGAEGLVRKPVDVERLLSMVEAHCIH